MKKYFSAIVAFLISASSFAQSSSTDTLELADPTIFPYNNKYYFYGTVERGSGRGFLVYSSDDLTHWKLSEKNDGFALKKGDAFGNKGFWAPQVLQYKSKFYIAYTANEQIAIASSESPLGPFVNASKDSIPSTSKQIDPYIFIDDDGKIYLYHVRLTNGNRIFVAEMNEDLLSIKQSTLRECISGTEQWENTTNGNWPVTEGPTVIKHSGLYYLFYSANDFRNPDYAVGYATSDNPLGPWKKQSGNPILVKKMIGWNGTGHGDFFQKGKEWFYVFHTHHSNTRTGPRKTALIKGSFKKGNPDSMELDPRSFLFLTKEN